VSNVLSEGKREQVIALGRLGWSLRRIEKTVHIRRETISGYLKTAGIPVRPPGAWGRRTPAKPANEVITDSGAKCESAVGAAASANQCSSASACEPWREVIALALSGGRNAKAIWQDLVDDHSFGGGYQSVRRFVHRLRGAATPEARVVITTPPGQYIQVACEQVGENTESLNSKESLISLFEALLAVRELRPGRGVELDRYYLGNIGMPGQASEMAWNDRQLDPDLVPNVSRKWIDQLRNTALPQRPIFAGRNLAVALRDEDLPDIVALNQALRPFLPTLFRLAARGHWAREKRPLRTAQERRFEHTVLPEVKARGFRLDFTVSSQGDLSILLSMEQKDVAYPIAPYSEIREFLAMLESQQPGSTWNGVHFLGYTTEPQRFVFRRRAEGIELGFSQEEWAEMRALFRLAMAAQNLQALFTELSLVYGEL
jgi:hypothetical protein